MTLDEIVKTAVIGTGRGGAVTLNQADETGSLVTAAAPSNVEATLLTAGAVLANFEYCGRVSAEIDSVPPAAAADRMPACSRRAGELLAEVLAMSATPTKQSLLAEWLTSAARSGRRPPHLLLPALLDEAATTRAIRPILAPILDSRGQWLTEQNPRWRFAAEATDADQIWSTGTPAQRAELLVSIRRTDPAAARERIASTWKQDGADERAWFIQALTEGLSDADEPMLEQALDDRSIKVRQTAGDLLVRLPDSGYVKRMTARAEALLTFTPGIDRKLLKAAKPARAGLSIPAASEPDWIRDGLVEKSTATAGEKQNWARQIVGRVPPGHWTEKFGVSPAGLVAAAAGDHRDLLIEAWADAAARALDVEWSRALLLDTNRKSGARLRVDLLTALDAASARSLLADLLDLSRIEYDTVQSLIGQTKFGLDDRIAEKLVTRIEGQILGGSRGYDYTLGMLLQNLVLRLPPRWADELSTRWTQPEWEQNRKAVDAFLSTMPLRRDIQNEFSI